MSTESAITIYDPAALQPGSISIEEAASGFRFTEGPVWHPDGFLLFSDTPANQIWQLFPDGSRQVYLSQSGFSGMDTTLLSDMIGSNGLAVAADKTLIICQHGNHALACLREGALTTLASHYKGRSFNSPNDVAIRSDGSIWFSDPPYGLKDQVLHPDSFQPCGGVYRYKDGATERVCSDMAYANGVCFSPDETRLYVSSNHPDEATLWQYEVSANGSITGKSVLIQQNADGIKTDGKGQLYLCTDNGILIVSAEGKKLALLHLPESPANLAFLPDYTTFYTTARGSIFRVSGLPAHGA
ncbi:MAG: SMP-30/gluconolactonase/LRE family protein [Chitinophagaceae bacterium]